MAEKPLEPEAPTNLVGVPETITDYISGRQVRATQEELDAVQVFSRRLVEEMGFPKSHIQTRPQFRVRASPSSKGTKSYPVDIIVFSSSSKLESDAIIVIECKKKTRKDGEDQLKIYLTMSPAQIGVWFNGKDYLYLLKDYTGKGQIRWTTLLTLQKFGQSVADIGNLRRSDLITPINLRSVFRDIRHHLAGNTTGITRDQELAIEITSILFCKIFDEINSAPDDLPQFRVFRDESPREVLKRVGRLFSAVKEEYPDVF